MTSQPRSTQPSTPSCTNSSATMNTSPDTAPPPLHQAIDAILHELQREDEHLAGDRGPERRGQRAQVDDAGGAVAEPGQHGEHPQLLHAQAHGETKTFEGHSLDPA